jgi:hypothetical protein
MESKKLSVLKATAGTEKRSNNQEDRQLKSSAGAMFLAKEQQHAWNGFGGRRDFDAVGAHSPLGATAVGLLPERRA